MRIAIPVRWQEAAEAAMWFIVATLRRSPAGGNGNPAGDFWWPSDSVAPL
jgi:hypothetical protein